MWRMLQLEGPQDFVVASGRSASLERLVEAIFAAFELDWRDHVTAGTKAQPRPSDIRFQHADPILAADRLGWSGRIEIDELAARLAAPPEIAFESGR
jgi:GDPmannose 4,6-dehydratase